jgi:hypothetical protein
MTADIPPLPTLADRVTWLIAQAHAAGSEPMSDYDVARLVRETTGHTVTASAIWKLRTGKTQNPGWDLIDALARTFAVPAGWFSASLNDVDAESVTAQIALLAELRNLGFQGYHLATMRKVDPRVRSAIITMIEEAGRALSLPDSGEIPLHEGKPGTEADAVSRRAQ